jgi:two-component system OmpR family sensor kinase
MFRSLATRLTATYVFAAIVLVVIVSSAVTAFALSMFGVASHETTDEVARAVPDDVKLELGRSHDLVDAAPHIAQDLLRPGVRVVVFATSGRQRRFLASTFSDGSGGTPTLIVAPKTVTIRTLFRGPNVTTIVGAAPFDAGGPRDFVPGGPHDFGAGGPGGGGPGGAPFGFNFGGPGLMTSGGPGGPPGSNGRYERMTPFPFFLNIFLHLEPKDVAFSGGRITIIPDPAPLWRAINAFWVAMLPIGIFVVCAAWVLGRYITGQALRPLVETTASLNRFGAGDFTPRPVVTSDRNEIGELVRAYNAAAAQVSAAFDERRAAELEMRQFVADAGHELRTPLTVIMGFIDVLRRRGQVGGINEGGVSGKIYDTMLAESRRMKTLIDKLILLARLENSVPRELETVALGEVAGSVVSAMQALGVKPRIALAVETGALVRGYENELHDALANLVENALKYAPESPVDVRVYDDGPDVALDVVDRGPGIPAAEQSQVFARFYRGRDRVDTEGFGLGLAIARRAVERAGGEILLASVPGQGCRFTVRVPRAERGESGTLAV